MAASICIGLAQIPVVKGGIVENLAQHLAMIEQSSRLGANLVVFPELSLTGYELELAQELAFSPNPENFSVLCEAAIKHNIVVIAGCPLKAEESIKPTIGAVICFPNGAVEFYSKQYLHDGEGAHCSRGSRDYLFDVNGYRIGLAVCADFSAPEHSSNLSKQGAAIYITSALISDTGFEADAKILSGIASTYQIPVLLSNHISKTGGWSTCGNNTIWDQSGEVVFCSESKEPYMVLCTVTDQEIIGAGKAICLK